MQVGFEPPGFEKIDDLLALDASDERLEGLHVDKVRQSRTNSRLAYKHPGARELSIPEALSQGSRHRRNQLFLQAYPDDVVDEMALDTDGFDSRLYLVEGPPNGRAQIDIVVTGKLRGENLAALT